MFVVFEGLDRSGKSTQARLLVKRINERAQESSRLNARARAREGLRESSSALERAQTSTLFQFPDRTTSTGKLIDAYLKRELHLPEQAAHLLFSANRWEHNANIRSLLQQGVHVVADRYCYSGIAYSVAAGLDLEWCANADAGLIRPDVIIYLDVHSMRIDEVARRYGFGDERYENADMQKQVHDAYARVMSTLEPHIWRTINASLPVEVISDQVDAILAQLN